jgi:O-antigen ligase
MNLARLSNALPWALLLFAAAAFLLPSEPSYALVFYVAVIPTLAARLIRGPRALTASTALALALVAWSGLTLLWGIDDGHRSFRFLGDTLSTACLVLAMAAALPDPIWRRRLITLLITVGAANAAWSIAVFFITHPVYPRLRGWGATLHPILGAAVMAVPYLTALAGTLPDPRRNWGKLLAAIVMAMFIILTESRGPLLAAALGTVFLCAAGPWRWRAFATLAAAAVIWWALPAALHNHAAKVLVSRGESHRLEIWTYTLNTIRERPLFGHGLAANLHFVANDPITFPHDLYLSLLFYSGAVGLALFAALATLLSWRLIRARKAPEFPWLAALWLNLLVAGLTDLGQITKGPGPLWLIVWLPMGLIATYPMRSKPAPS